MNRLKQLFPLITALALLGCFHLQADKGGADEHWKAFQSKCQADIKQFCDGKEHHELMECMHQNQDKLSAGCKKAHQHHSAAMKQKMEAVRGLCSTDIDAMCKGMEGGHMMKCLHENQEKLSPGCKGALPHHGPHGGQ